MPEPVAELKGMREVPLGRKGASSLELEGRTPEGGGLSDLRRRRHLWTREGCSGVCGGGRESGKVKVEGRYRVRD